MLNLAELVALRPDLQKLQKIIYFHENQLMYPKRAKEKQADWGLRWSAVVSGLVADVLLFNSAFNMRSFLDAIPPLLRTPPKGSRPDPDRVAKRLESKARVLYFPLNISGPPVVPAATKTLDDDGGASRPLHIVWAHRWEFDKGPDRLFAVLRELHEKGLRFIVSVLGESFTEVPDLFEENEAILSAGGHVKHKFGYRESKDEYVAILKSADVCLSTANHEFYGVSTLEAVWLGCVPLCPNRLAYPEFFPKECLYNTDRQLAKKLRNWCLRPRACREIARRVLSDLDLTRFHWRSLRGEYEGILKGDAADSGAFRV